MYPWQINPTFSLWATFYQSLKRGYGTIGFEDYVTGIMIRGGMTTLHNDHSSFSYARNQEDRFKEKQDLLFQLI